MAAIWVPLMALYEYDNTILDGLHVPTAAELPANVDYINPIPTLSDEVLRNNLLLELAELCPVYTDPEVLKKMIVIWAAMEKRNWLQLWATTLYKYNPIWNKDGSYTETRNRSGSNANNNSATGSTKYGRTDEHQVTGYDTNSYSPDTKDLAGGTDTTSSSGNASGTYKDAETITRKDHS